MKELVKGKKYEVAGVSVPLRFADRNKAGKPVGEGTTIEELMRACIMRLRFENDKYGKAQEEHLVSASNHIQAAIADLQQVMHYEEHKVFMAKQTTEK